MDANKIGRMNGIGIFQRGGIPIPMEGIGRMCLFVLFFAHRVLIEA